MKESRESQSISGEIIVVDPPEEQQLELTTQRPSASRTFVRMSLSLYETHKLPEATPTTAATTITITTRERLYLLFLASAIVLAGCFLMVRKRKREREREREKQREAHCLCVSLGIHSVVAWSLDANGERWSSSGESRKPRERKRDTYTRQSLNSPGRFSDTPTTKSFKFTRKNRLDVIRNSMPFPYNLIDVSEGIPDQEVSSTNLPHAQMRSFQIESKMKIHKDRCYNCVSDAVRGKKVPEKWSPGKKSSEKCPQKIVLRQKNARKFERIFVFIDWFHYTHKNLFDVHLTILHVPN